NRLLFKNAPDWADRIIGGWQLSSIAQWQSGAPLQFIYPNGQNVGTLYNNGGQSNTYDQVGPVPQGQLVKGNGYVTFFPTLTTQKAALPNFGGDSSLPGVFTNQIAVDSSVKTVFQNADPGRVGNLTYNAAGIRGPGMLTFNAALTKSI